MKDQFSSVPSLSRVWLSVTPLLQCARLPCPSPTPGARSDSYPLNQWCHPTISSSTNGISMVHNLKKWFEDVEISEFHQHVKQGNNLSGYSLQKAGWSVDMRRWVQDYREKTSHRGKITVIHLRKGMFCLPRKQVSRWENMPEEWAGWQRLQDRNCC